MTTAEEAWRNAIPSTFSGAYSIAADEAKAKNLKTNLAKKVIMQWTSSKTKSEFEVFVPSGDEVAVFESMRPAPSKDYGFTITSKEVNNRDDDGVYYTFEASKC